MGQAYTCSGCHPSGDHATQTERILAERSPNPPHQPGHGAQQAQWNWGRNRAQLAPLPDTRKEISPRRGRCGAASKRPAGQCKGRARYGRRKRQQTVFISGCADFRAPVCAVFSSRGAFRSRGKAVASHFQRAAGEAAESFRQQCPRPYERCTRCCCSCGGGPVWGSGHQPPW